ncbi:hypothetical protein [Novosphingobium sp. AAP93]|uniref:hypothetical protein n=1 Tax=Novosphingobium sp. AAP93 TaxID=1523427 RepID=UPI0006B8DEEF|nr:hypothetical protein [Novosphingobium sp. AAP93]KPF83465.1 hypothetical protein IP83_10380 [Novosphingobium sp. AAP93]
MTTEAQDSPLDAALDRIEQAIIRLEAAVAAAPAPAEVAELRSRHRRLKERVSEEIQQLDLLLANLPQ